MSLALFHAVYRPALDSLARPLVLLHGTGGDESELMLFADKISPGSAKLALRGNVVENGKLRFFARLADGIFDETEVLARAREIARFIKAARQEYGFLPPVAIGYSNGANVIAAMLQHHSGVLSGAVLLRAVNPLKSTPTATLHGTRVLVLEGIDDPIAPPELGEQLAETLRSCHAEVSLETLSCGHELTNLDAEMARRWFDEWSVDG